MIMETKIKKFFKESNAIEDLSGDYVEITMSMSTYQLLKFSLIDASFNGLNRKRAERIKELLDKAFNEGKSEWI